MSSIPTLGAALLFVGSLGGACAQPADCVKLDDAAARLDCYDRLHGRAAGAPPPRFERPAGTSATVAAPVAPVAPVASVAPAPRAAASRLAERWDLKGETGSLFSPRAYRPVYLLPATLTDAVNRRPGSPTPDHSVANDLELRAVESKYQISLKAKLGQDLLGSGVSLWGGYTQSSRWQVYNGAASRPFRETNYEPELMLVWPLQGEVWGWRLGMGSVSLTHESNGRSLPLSRSWNRLIGGLALERGEWTIELRPWLRIHEERADDDNPDIKNHIGRGELVLSRNWGEHALSLQLRHSLRGGERSRGSAQLDWVFPLSGALYGYFQAFSGQGESLVDYNHRQTKLGLGVTIAGWR